MTEALVAFLRERLSEDKAFVQAAMRLRGSMAMAGSPARDGALALADVVLDDPQSVAAITLFTRNRVRAPGEAERTLAEIEAKHAIINEVAPIALDESYQGPDYYGGTNACEKTLKFLAIPYVDHPDYRDEWRP